MPTIATVTMTSEAKRALARTIRGLRGRLIEELGAAMERAYLLSIDAKKAQLDEAARVKRARLERAIEEQVRGHTDKGAKDAAAARLRAEVVTDAAATLLVRLVYLRLLEASGLVAVKVVTGGWASRGYRDFCEVAPELVRADETEGYAALLGLVFDELAHELPGLYGPVRMTALVPVPAATLRAVIEALNDPELATVWTDDTALGWIYQYWNDPERERLDAKLAAAKKLENHEIASKTQMFTERYMVEWLLQNTLGQLWLAMCKQHGWHAEAQASGLLDRLEERRIAWRARREAGEVALDAMMPIEPGLEERWKYWVPQPLPDDAVASAPASVRDLTLLDPACGSGHFLVIACDLLFALYQEEARHRGEVWSDREIVESILERNLHGLDIDPKAVQLAAAALMLKARQLCAQAEPRTLNLVAPAFSLARLPGQDPALRELYAAVKDETGIPEALTATIVGALTGADHLGTLLKVDAAIDAAIEQYGAQLSAAVPSRADQGDLFTGHQPRRRKRITAETAKAAVLDRLEAFLRHHTGGADLGLRLRGEQLAAGVRFVRLVREGQYDLVIGNPPYQGTSKLADKAYVEKEYPRGKADLYAAFLERGLQLVKPGGVSALLTMRNWMFIKQFSALREWLLATYDLRMLGDVDRGAFEEVPDEVVAAVMSVFRSAPPSETPSVAMQPTPLEDKARDSERTKRKRAAVLCQVGRYEFEQSSFGCVLESPVLYWWSVERRNGYSQSKKLGEVAPVRMGISTSDNGRFVRMCWEVSFGGVSGVEGGLYEYLHSTWRPLISGAAGVAWLAPLELVVHWRDGALELETSAGAVLRNPMVQMLGGIAFTPMGNAFSARLHRFKSVFDAVGRSVIHADLAPILAAMNSTHARSTICDLSPAITFTVGDVERMPLVPQVDAAGVVHGISLAFGEHEAHREPSVEFRRPGPSPWRHAQEWAQLAVDRPDGAPLPPYEPVYDPEPPTDHLSFAIGVALGRFGANGEGILTEAPATALPHGILFLSDATDTADSLAHPAAAPILAAWATHGPAIDDKRTLKNYLQDKFFPDVHRKLYENRPIYFPLSSAKKAFVAYVSIHRWTASTLNDLLAEHLYPAKRTLEGEVTDLRAARDGADKKAAKAAEKRFGEVGKWLEELNGFIAAVEQCADRGPPPPDSKTKPREVDARYVPVLDDGVMINSAALWPLLEPQWKDPKKWWKELANADGKKDYDWAHLAARYFPTRVDGKCQDDPSLAVAHGCFWRYHPAKAYQWELRLQDELRPDFTLDENDKAASDAARAAFEAAHPDTVEELVAKEHQRRQRKLAKASGAPDDDEPEAQGSLELDAAPDPDAADDEAAP
ncbi:MAG: BREX-6 system adenine-specific DNA-methyltransferase PglX [Kofleriaceae bacterium]|nr:BREX-6 system adenine-specific DNA-methyltransferase PglX [Kofleriaceae bacterium]MBP9170627.1 BREX-6 system adenine-specific DNA-methyltransferase PglX [Kofleriaceae bacterium]MBP9859789.1 BREX-6 system adenine-specific DNA-methyltransferase PglX [Kofleriaceae bacterium]